MKRKHAILCAVALMLAAAPITTAPVEAGGSFTFSYTPDGKKAKALKRGLTKWSRFRDRVNSARVKQRGRNNSAHLGQSGDGNTVGVYQRGSGHSASASQTNGGNTLGIFQFGKNTSTDVTQNGGETGLIIQGGW